MRIGCLIRCNKRSCKEVRMDIIISNTSGVPIYEQIEEQIKSQIMTGSLVAGEALPSMRVLAKELKISIITTKSSFVKAVNSDIVKENMMFEIQELLDKACDKAVIGKVTRDELKEMIDLLYDEKQKY